LGGLFRQGDSARFYACFGAFGGDSNVVLTFGVPHFPEGVRDGFSGFAAGVVRQFRDDGPVDVCGRDTVRGGFVAGVPSELVQLLADYFHGPGGAVQLDRERVAGVHHFRQVSVSDREFRDGLAGALHLRAGATVRGASAMKLAQSDAVMVGAPSGGMAARFPRFGMAVTLVNVNRRGQFFGTYQNLFG
jgi:hypothetical protein